MWLPEAEKFFEDMFIDRMYERDIYTDRQTDRHRMTANARLAQHRAAKNGNKTSTINVKNFHGSLTTAVRAQNDTSKTAIPFLIEHTSDGVLKIGEIRRSVYC